MKKDRNMRAKNNSRKKIIYSILLFLITSSPAMSEQSIIYSNIGPNHQELCSGQGYPKSRNYINDCNMIGSFGDMSSLFPHTKVKKGREIFELPYKSPSSPKENRLYNIAANLISDHPATSLIIWADGGIIFEAYQYGMNENTLFTSFSMQKSFLGQLIGVALNEGKISSLDDKVTKYYQELTGTGWSDVSLLQALTMTSSMPVDQRGLLVPILFKNMSVTESLRRHSKATGTHGSSFQYNDANSLVLGKVLENAYGESLASITSKKIWSKIGAESDATILTNRRGEAVSNSFFNARSRDYLRWGLLLLSNGKNAFGDQVIPEDWVEQISGKGGLTSKCPLRRGCLPGGFGYSAQTWLAPNSDGFLFMGKYGQEVAIFPKSRTVIVMTGASKDPIMTSKFFSALVREAGQ
jgi:CubicO group peptidase (beta-lactamase class C family)